MPSSFLELLYSVSGSRRHAEVALAAKLEPRLAPVGLSLINPVPRQCRGFRESGIAAAACSPGRETGGVGFPRSRSRVGGELVAGFQNARRSPTTLNTTLFSSAALFSRVQRPVRNAGSPAFLTGSADSRRTQRLAAPAVSAPFKGMPPLPDPIPGSPETALDHPAPPPRHSGC